MSGAAPSGETGKLVYKFGDYEIDSTGFTLSRGGRTVAVEPQVLELLIMLIHHRDRVVSRDELLAEIWKGRIVSDTTLSSRVKTARQAIGDNGARQRYIKTIHGRGFRFVGQVEVREARPPAPVDVPRDSPLAERPATRYARSGEIHIAYQLFGEGPVNLILTPGFVSNIDNYWDDPNFAWWLTRMAGFARIAMFDKRGTGMSDQVNTLPGMDERMDDVRAVMDAVGFETAFLLGISEGGSLAALFAGHHPERCNGLILYGSFPRFQYWFADEEQLQGLFDYIERDWGSGESLPQFAPSMVDDPSFVAWWGKFERLGATPGAALSLMRMNSKIDVTGILPSIEVPTLVIHRSEDVLIDVEGGRYLAENIPGAKYVELPGSDHLPWVGDNKDEVVDTIGRFLRASEDVRDSTRVLATILMIRFGEGATSQEVEAGRTALEGEYRRFRSSRVESKSLGMVGSFDGPARALKCAVSASRLMRGKGLDHQIGIHTGEVGVGTQTLGGTALEIAVDVASHADTNEILVSRTVSDLVAGSDITLEDRGEFFLPAIDQAWQLFRAARP